MQSSSIRPPATNHNKVARYNTALPFSDSASWETFDLTTGISADGWHQDATYDGRYIYFCPYGHDFVRYDTQGSFTSAGSWTKYNLTNVSALQGSKFVGILYDGSRYVHLVPCNNSFPSYSTAIRYDTQGGFTTLGSYTTFDTTLVAARARGFGFGVKAGNYLYFCPWDAGIVATDISGLVVRYNTTLSYTDPASWESFDATAVHADCKGYNGGFYDGTRYVYFAPIEKTRLQVDGYQLLRYDTQGSFTNAGSWANFALTGKWLQAKGFCTATFDGRYGWLVGYGASGGGSRMTVRVDTQGTFTANASYRGVDYAQRVSSVDSRRGFSGAAVCNGSVYFAPNEHNEVMRVPVAV